MNDKWKIPESKLKTAEYTHDAFWWLKIKKLSFECDFKFVFVQSGSNDSAGQH